MDAVLSALAALAKENPTLANMLAKPSLERDREFFTFFSRLAVFFFLKTKYITYFFVTLEPPALVNILGFTKSRSVEVQLAACLW